MMLFHVPLLSIVLCVLIATTIVSSASRWSTKANVGGIKFQYPESPDTSSGSESEQSVVTVVANNAESSSGHPGEEVSAHHRGQDHRAVTAWLSAMSSDGGDVPHGDASALDQLNSEMPPNHAVVGGSISQNVSPAAGPFHTNDRGDSAHQQREHIEFRTHQPPLRPNFWLVANTHPLEPHVEDSELSRRPVTDGVVNYGWLDTPHHTLQPLAGGDGDGYQMPQEQGAAHGAALAVTPVITRGTVLAVDPAVGSGTASASAPIVDSVMPPSAVVPAVTRGTASATGTASAADQQAVGHGHRGLTSRLRRLRHAARDAIQSIRVPLGRGRGDREPLMQSSASNEQLSQLGRIARAFRKRIPVRRGGYERID